MKNFIKEKKNVLVSIVLFFVTVIVIILLHLSTFLDSFHIDYSISRYVGLTCFSSVAFLVVNTFVSFSIWRFLKPVLKTKTQRTLIAAVAILLIGLSICPFGYYDYIIPEPVLLGRTPITFLHMLFARSMFFVMSAFSAVTFYLSSIKNLYRKNTKAVSLLFFVYSVACIVTCIFVPSLFWNNSLILESLYILLFFILVLTF